ncbi:MAG: hypothetical protein OEZ13_10605 [Spirochaetia bacterium]|nr:hypothetical protein [Spirochaetia bacterium]
MAVKRKISLWAFLFFIAPALYSAETIYRPYDVYFPGARSAGAGGTSAANIDSIGMLPGNTAYLAEINHSALSLGFDAQTRITSLNTKLSIKPQYLPIIALGFPVHTNSGAGIMIYSPFQRYFPDGDFLMYNIEGAFAHTVSENLSIGVSCGVALGIQAKEYFGTGFSYGAAFLFRHNLFDAGLHIKPGATLKYKPFANGKNLKESMPHIIRAGVSKKLNSIKFSFDLQYNEYSYIYFIEDEQNLAPDFEKGFLGRINMHAGFDFLLSFWKGLHFRTGFLTDDYYDHTGKNEKQILFTLGFGGFAGSDLWEEKLKIDISLISAYLPSFFWKKSHQIEKFQATIEFVF